MSGQNKKRTKKRKAAKQDAHQFFVPPRWLTWGLFLLMLLLPLLLRVASGAPVIALDSSYENLLSAENPATLDAWLLSIFVSIGAPWLLPVLLGIAAFALLEQALPAIMDPVTNRVKQYALLLIAITPLMITTYTTLTPLALFGTVFLLGLWSYSKHTHYTDILAIISFLALPFILSEGVIISMLFILHAVIRKRERFAIVTLLLVLVALLIAVLHEWTFGILQLEPAALFGELGGLFGYSFFIFLLALITILANWKGISKVHALIFLFLLVGAAFLPGLRIVTLLPLVLYAAHAIVTLVKRQWEIPFLRQATLLLLGCLGLFVILAHTQALAQETPEQALVQLLEQDLEPDGAILAPAAYNGVVRYFTGNEVIVPEEAGVVTPAVYGAITMGEAVPWLKQGSVRYILVTPEMRTGDVWQREDEGLLFLLGHNDKFISAGSAEGFELWLFLQEYAG